MHPPKQPALAAPAPDDSKTEPESNCKADIDLPSYSADVRLWKLGEYTDQETQLPLLIDPDWIVGQLGMTTVSIGKDRTKVWATIDLSKVLVLVAHYEFVISDSLQ